MLIGVIDMKVQEMLVGEAAVMGGCVLCQHAYIILTLHFPSFLLVTHYITTSVFLSQELGYTHLSPEKASE